MANERKWIKGIELILETAASSALITSGTVRECDSDNRQPTDNAGYPWGLFEFSTAAGGFSIAPTAGAVINIYEQKINSDGNDAPNVSLTYKYDYIGRFIVTSVDEQQHLSTIAEIHPEGGKYWVQWIDGGSGTAQVVLGWELRLTPLTEGT